MSLAFLHDQHLKLLAGHYGHVPTGRADSAAYVVQCFHRLVELLEPELFIEAGAYRADASRAVKEAHPGARVVAFEANPYNYQEYAGSLGFEDLGIEYLHHAVTDVPGPVTFHLRRRDTSGDLRQITGNSSLLRRTDADVEYDEIPVEGITLDGFFADDRSERIALWIDVEGASASVLRGGIELLRRSDLVMIEVEEKSMWRGQWQALDVLDFLLGLDFVPVLRDIEYENQYNVLFVSQEFYRRADVQLQHELQLNWLVNQMSVRGLHLP